MRVARDGASELTRALRDHGGMLAAALISAPGETVAPAGADSRGSFAGAKLPADLPGPPQLAAAGPRTAGREAEYELLLEMILEGSLLHYGRARVLRADDCDLALLLGDELYAQGLSRLAQLGDLDAVAELADLISLVATARAAERPELVDAIWRAGAAAIGWGTSAEHEAAKALARAGDPGATAALEAAADSTTWPAALANPGSFPPGKLPMESAPADSTTS